MNHQTFSTSLLGLWLFSGCSSLETVRVDPCGRGFALSPSNRRFVPWGFNYDHDETGRLLEEYWHAEWPKVEEDFREMKDLGVNTVRVHLQFGKFMRSADQPDEAELERLDRLVALAEELGLYLDITGLACYLKVYVPAWYDQLAEAERWEAQARFWEAVAARVTRSPAIFCYDLMNEPVSPAGRREAGDWLGPPFAEKYHFVQMIALDQAGRPRPEIALRWIERLVKAIRKHDQIHLITAGLVPWSLDRPGLTSGFAPEKIAGALDFVSVHIYPEAGKIQESLDTLKGFAAGKPVVIEEIFPLHCSMDEFRCFFKESASIAAGWIGFYWGMTIEECRKSAELKDKFVLDWLEFFLASNPTNPGGPS